MKYIVITSKHHDGFNLFDASATDYHVMSTPFKRGIMKEMADACGREGIRGSAGTTPSWIGTTPITPRGASGKHAAPMRGTTAM